MSAIKDYMEHADQVFDLIHAAHEDQVGDVSLGDNYKQEIIDQYAEEHGLDVTIIEQAMYLLATEAL